MNEGRLFIDPDEVLRYLGLRSAPPDEGTRALIGECREEMASLARPRTVYRELDVRFEEEGVRLGGSGLLLPGEDIRRHLDGCAACFLLAATLGGGVDRAVAALQVRQMAKALVLDCCATAAIEEVCDKLQRELEETLQAEGRYATTRYSPGYGDLPITCQRELTALLDTSRKIGLCATRENILTPRKSVTAIIGISKRPLPARRRSCESCGLRQSCNYRRGGRHCGDS